MSFTITSRHIHAIQKQKHTILNSISSKADYRFSWKQNHTILIQSFQKQITVSVADRIILFSLIPFQKLVTNSVASRIRLFAFVPFKIGFIRRRNRAILIHSFQKRIIDLVANRNILCSFNLFQSGLPF